MKCKYCYNPIHLADGVWVDYTDGGGCDATGVHELDSDFTWLIMETDTPGYYNVCRVDRNGAEKPETWEKLTANEVLAQLEMELKF